ncbi:unnamed protein product [Polarella glacialis]|uniref:Uncharacterized protein n=1 Tax=Polarella glacialis TaxID=89957 RepID=A0A813HZ12_POLGL|nr:unnamed protein product [Polarella glacialis]
MLEFYAVLQRFARMGATTGRVSWDDLPTFLRMYRELATSQALELHRQLVAEEEMALPSVTERRRQSLHQKLKRLAPGNAGALCHLEDSHGNLCSDDDSIARALATH